MRVLDSATSVAVESDTRAGAFSPYRTLPAIQRLAEIAARHPMVLNEIASFVVHEGMVVGYYHKSLDPLRRQSLRLLPREPAKRAFDLLNGIADEFRSVLPEGSPGDRVRELGKKFSAGITEAILDAFLRNSNRSWEDVTCDARIYIGAPPVAVNGSNIDAVWADAVGRAAEAYECKNDPMWLLKKWATRSYPGNEAVWRKSKLFMMFRFKDVLESASWNVLLACFTLRTVHRVQNSRQYQTVGWPQEVTLCCLEDILAVFPSSSHPK